MRYLPKSPSDREQMLAEIGVSSIDDLFACVPGEYRLSRMLDVPRQMAESEIVDQFRDYAARNAAGYASFLGAGAYQHYRPVIIDALVQRGEFLTSYTPYQAEIAQGTLQAIFEFQTMICELTGQEIANASMYDGSTGAAEAIMMSVRLTGRDETIIARSVHPEYREVVRTYGQHQGLVAHEVDFELASGRVDLKSLEAALTDKTASVVIQSPNFFGCIEDVDAIAEMVHKKGALLIVSIAEAISLGAVKPPSAADIVSMECQSYGVALSYGGPYCGVLATKEKFVRQMPGRLVGETTDTNGKRGFVLTLATREQHIRREKATSNICTNQALIALMCTVYLMVYGREGLKDLAYQNLAKAAYAAAEFGKAGEVLFAGTRTPRFNEFVLQTDDDPHDINRRLLEKKIMGGLPLKRWYPELGNAALWCVTEMNTRAEIDAAAATLNAGGASAHNRDKELVGQK
ncbi:MAG: aminomethyl-transferring glycine dehydrogenase subunit GcvPA [Acidobacteriaceae bacterium]